MTQIIIFFIKTLSSRQANTNFFSNLVNKKLTQIRSLEGQMKKYSQIYNLKCCFINKVKINNVKTV